MECLRTTILTIALAGVACATAHAQLSPREPMRVAAEALRGPNLEEEVSRQFGIFQSKGEERPEGYVIDRSLIAYSFMLRSGFAKALANLGTTDRWLDIGAGQGQAILDYYGERFDAMHPEGRERRGKKARAVAISIEDRRTRAWYETGTRLDKDQIQYLSGRRLREYAPEELGRFQLISDLLGGFTYTQDLSLFVENVLALLDLNGRFYTLLQHVQYENGPGRPAGVESAFQTEVVNADGSSARICSWLKSITCVEVACEQKAQGSIPIEAYRVRKVCDNVVVPALTTVRYEAGAPPERRFQWSNTPAARPVQAGAER